jgi:hypothetical protein
MNIFDEMRKLAEAPEVKPEPVVIPKPKAPVPVPVKAPAQITKLVVKSEPETWQETRKRIENSDQFKKMYSDMQASHKAQHEKWLAEYREEAWKKYHERTKNYKTGSQMYQEAKEKREARERETKIQSSILPRFLYVAVERITNPRKRGNK